MELDLQPANRFYYKNFNDLGFQALKMKYTSSNAYLLVLLPKNRTVLSDLENKLHTVELKRITDEMSFEKEVRSK